MASDPVEVRKALSLLSNCFSELERRVADLTISDRQKDATIEGLERRTQKAEEKLGPAQRCCEELTEKQKELVPRIADLIRRLGEEERRVNDAETQSAILSEKAAKYERLFGDAERLLDALDRLPLKIEEGRPVPNTGVVPEIALYGTYEWKAVMDAKLALASEIRKGEQK